MAQGLVGVNGVPRNISEIKVGVNGVRNVTEMYVGVNGAPRLCWSGNKWNNKLFIFGTTSVYKVDTTTLAPTYLGNLYAYPNTTRSAGGGFKYIIYSKQASGEYTRHRADPNTLATIYKYTGFMDYYVYADAKASFSRGYGYMCWTPDRSNGMCYRSPEDGSVQLDKTRVDSNWNRSFSNNRDVYSITYSGSGTRYIKKILTYVPDGTAVQTTVATLDSNDWAGADVSDTAIYAIHTRVSPIATKKYDINTGALIASTAIDVGTINAHIAVLHN